MRVGDTAVYISVNGVRTVAEITRLTGSGPSGYKTLNLQLPGGTQLNDVPHAKDRLTGSSYWLCMGEETQPSPLEARGHAAFDAAAAGARGGTIDNATNAELEVVADAYGFNEDGVKGTGSEGGILKRDWLRELKRRRG